MYSDNYTLFLLFMWHISSLHESTKETCEYYTLSRADIAHCQAEGACHLKPLLPRSYILKFTVSICLGYAINLSDYTCTLPCCLKVIIIKLSALLLFLIESHYGMTSLITKYQCSLFT